MFRLYSLLIWICLPCVSVANPTKPTTRPAPSATVQQHLNRMLEPLIRNEELSELRRTNQGKNAERVWYDDLRTWLSMQSRSDRFDTGQNRNAAQRLDFITLSTYRINTENKLRNVAPFSALEHPVLAQLPGVGLEDSVRFTLTVGAGVQTRHLAVTTQSPHTIHFNGSCH